MALLTSAGSAHAQDASAIAQLIQASSKVTTPWSLAAFAIAALVVIVSLLVIKPNAATRKIMWICAAAITFLGLVPIIVSVFVVPPVASVYRIRVTVVGPGQTPVEDAKVWSTIGGEAKKVAGGWEFDIPVASKPATGKFTVFAEQPNAFLAGSREIVLGADTGMAMAVTVPLEKVKPARVRGFVQNEEGATLGGARVMVAGYAGEMIVTSDNGGFELPAHAASGQHVLVHVQKDGYVSSQLSHLAGDDPLVVMLRKKQSGD
ncbi:MAG: hypothetical protein HY848_02570 [Betaproteobacteria bacterium]|nr:hypothetical protein [Betaproteobacteria bacterium]